MAARLPPRLALGGEEAAAAPPREVVRVLIPRGQDGRHALARQQARDLGPQRGEAGVAAGVQRRVARQRREVGEVGAHRVEHGQRAVGAADRDVDVEAEHHLPLDRPRVRRLERVVPGEVAQRALGRGERMRARAGQPRPARDAGAELAPRRGERPRGLVDRVAHRRGGLDLGGGQLPAQRHALAELRVHARGGRQQVERVRGRAASAPPRRRPCGRVTPSKSARSDAALTVASMRGRYPSRRLARRGGEGRVQQACASSSSPGSCARPATPPCSAASWPAHDLAGRTVLDLCTGTGILGLTAARLGARATAVDLSRRAVLNARLNARLNRLALEVLRGDLFAPVRGRRFDLIVSNPPYIPAPPGDAPRGEARAWDAGPDGREFLDRICDRAADAPAPRRARAARALEPRAARRRPSAGSPRTASSRPSPPSTTGASARSRGSGSTTCARSASPTRRSSERMVVVEGRARRRSRPCRERRPRPPRGRPRQRARGRRPRGRAARRAARRRGRGRRADDGRVGRGRDVRAHRGRRHRADRSRRRSRASCPRSRPTCARCRRRR